MKVVLVIFGVIFALSLIVGAGFVLRIVLFPVNVASREIETAYDATNKIINADNAIYNYEWFKQQKEDIEARVEQLKAANASYQSFLISAGVRKDWTFEDKGEDARLRSVALGLENNLTQLIADYNARAKMATRNIFEDHVLPDYIDALTFIRK